MKSVYHVEKNFTEKDARDIVNDKRNYGFKDHGVTSLGKILDVIVGIEAFRESLKKARPRYSEVNIT